MVPPNFAASAISGGEHRAQVDGAYSFAVTVWVDAVIDPVEMASIGAMCRTPVDLAGGVVSTLGRPGYAINSTIAVSEPGSLALTASGVLGLAFATRASRRR